MDVATHENLVHPFLISGHKRRINALFPSWTAPCLTQGVKYLNFEIKLQHCLQIVKHNEAHMYNFETFYWIGNILFVNFYFEQKFNTRESDLSIFSF